jgi:hypothetical protein
VARKREQLPPAVSPAWREPEPPVEPPPNVDRETQAIRDCDRPGLEGGVNFFDLWKAQRGRGDLQRPLNRPHHRDLLAASYPCW